MMNSQDERTVLAAVRADWAKGIFDTSLGCTDPECPACRSYKASKALLDKLDAIIASYTGSEG